MSEALEAEITAWLSDRSERVVETACARVFLAGDTAWKLKRHVELGYVDFSTLERRRWALDRELAFNSAAAPNIYRAVRRLTREPGGGLAIDGAGEAVEYLLEMRRFDDRAVLAARPEAVDGPMAEALGRTIAGFHAKAPLRPKGGLTALAFTIRSNAELLRDLSGRLGADRVERLVALTDAELERQRPLLAARTAAGFSRQCHGDLHLGNILVEDGAPVLFDCIEFNDLLSDLDVQYDLAFLLMDLDFRGRQEAAVRVLSAYLDEAARHFAPEIWDGLAALPLMLSVRAGVRAHVSAHSGDDATAAAYVEAGIRHLDPAPLVLAAVGGFSGTGKSTFARLAAAGLGAAPGAVVLRTDEVRKRLFNVAPNARLDASAYTGAFYNRSYDVLIDNARSLLQAGRSVVLDATFIDPALRRRVEVLAREVGAPLRGAWLTAPTPVLEARIAARMADDQDASDADLQTLQDQIARCTSPADWPQVDTTGPIRPAVEAWTQAARDVA